MKTTAIISGSSPRAEEWRKVFGTNEVEVKGLLSTTANVRGKIREVYFLDLESLTDEQYERLMIHISEKFRVPLEQVARELPEIGVPILAEDLIISCDTPFFL